MQLHNRPECHSKRTSAACDDCPATRSISGLLLAYTLTIARKPPSNIPTSKKRSTLSCHLSQSRPDKVTKNNQPRLRHSKRAKPILDQSPREHNARDNNSAVFKMLPYRLPLKIAISVFHINTLERSAGPTTHPISHLSTNNKTN